MLSRNFDVIVPPEELTTAPLDRLVSPTGVLIVTVVILAIAAALIVKKVKSNRKNTALTESTPKEQERSDES